MAVAEHPLCWGGFVVDVAGIDLRAVFEQVGGDLNRAGEVERSLAVAASGVHELRIALHQLAEPVHQPQPCRGMNIDLGPQRDGVSRQLRRRPCEAVQNHPPTTGSFASRFAPAARRASIIAGLRAACEQRRIKRPQRLIDPRPEIGVAVEQRADSIGVIGSDRLRELINGGQCERVMGHRVCLTEGTPGTGFVTAAGDFTSRKA